jgi:hypothetical protein
LFSGVIAGQRETPRKFFEKNTLGFYLIADEKNEEPTILKKSRTGILS